MRIDPLTAKVWRHGIAFLIAFDAVQLVIRTRMRAPLAGSPLPVFPLFRDLALSTPALVALALVAVIAAALFARGRSTVLCGLLALGANRLLLEAFAALDGIYDETSYFAASALLGWLAGRAFARAIVERGGAAGREASSANNAAAERDSEVDTLSGLGAAAMFAATYLNAGTAKLHDSGVSWADSDTIRLLVLAHRPAGVPSWLDSLRCFAGASAPTAMALSIGTLVIQCGAFLFPWTRRTRLVWGALFVAFHVGIHLVAGSIFFLQAVYLAILFACPWPDVIRRTIGETPRRHLDAPATPASSEDLSRAPLDLGNLDSPLSAGQGRRVMLTAAAVLGGLGVLAIVPIRPRAHPIERIVGSAPAAATVLPERPPSVPALGPLTTGMDASDGWVLRTIVVEPERVVLTLARADQEVVFDLTDDRGAPKGRFDTGSLHVFYRQTPIPVDAFSGAGESIARRLAEGAAGGDVAGAFRGWVREARGRSP